MNAEIWARTDLSTACDAFMAATAANPEGACIAVPARADRDYLPGGAEWSYREVAASVKRLQALYAAAGFTTGHRIALLLDNRPDILVHMLALNGLGVCVLPLNPDYRQDDLRFVLGHAEVDLVVALPSRLRTLTGAVATLDVQPAIAVCEGDDPEIPAARRPGTGEAPGRETTAAILYTSGTTGMPKGCVIPNEYFYFAAERYLTAGGLMTVRFGQERLFNPLPMFYANSFAISNMAMIMSANCMIFPDRFRPKSWWRDLRETGATILHYLGLIPPVTLAAPFDPDERRHHVRFGVGAGIDPDQQRTFESRFGMPLVEVWGMSEVAISTAANVEPRSEGRRSIGRPLRGMEIALIDDRGDEVDPSMPGELCVRRAGPDPRRGLFREYFRDPEATAEAWRDGWFHTGDIVRREVDGSYTFVDRKKHMIRRSGQNIAAAEVESCLAQHEHVRQVACIPVPDDLRQEEVMACVVTVPERSGDAALAMEIVDLALARLAYFKAPGWVLFLDSLPTTSTQKLQKSAIVGPGEDPTMRPGCFDMRQRKQGAAKADGGQ
ncbi:AMP-binding protein [Oceanibacterium hippocampi]|uniref:Long-chain-fatty-acid--CoA ligase n=1 Tax=Oceanibacterium hippocampi TaxID=745714 RepID=A0A1Y5TTG5_9PROT|nr:AMP-binding protein [Oceanibacterium hippocampi]SLN71669.1 Long-chain-fatty-acid--CoA ligase [Oceanibacterium hippocampi]